MSKKAIFVLIIVLILIVSPILAQPNSNGDIEILLEKVNRLENIIEGTIDLTTFRLNIIMILAGFIATAAGLGLAIYGYFNINRADKIVEEKIENKLLEYKTELSGEFVKTQEAVQKMIAGYQCQSQNDIDNAILLYKKAVEILPTVYNGYTSLGYAYLQKKDIAQALLAFNEAKKIFPDRIESYNDLARVHAILGNKEECIENIERMAQMDKGSKSFLVDDQQITNVIDIDTINNIYDKS
ncbi:MAG: hypothetical protein GX201_05495 [Clostridiales bacterium]|nr:hypothetical protein [Clostridiales bacterium]